MLISFHFCLIFFALQVTGSQEPVEFLTFHDSNQQGFSLNAAPICAVVPNHYLQEVSSSVLMAERWTRGNVLANYPSINITSIVVGHNLLCEKGQEKNFSLILPSVRNIHYTLTRWGLDKEIKISVSFSSRCLLPNSEKYRDNIAETHIKPLLSFLQDVNSPYFLNLPSHLVTSSSEAEILLKSHSKAIESLGLFNISNKINVIIKNPPKEVKFPSRKLSSIFSFPARPTPVVAPANAPTVSSKSPLPPLIGKISPPPPLSLPFAPEMPPMINPSNPPYGFSLPPCAPPPYGGSGGAVAAPVGAPRRGLWCVAKPSVPTETLQQALDFACGEGGADCEAIRPHGSCYYPNTVLAHASYAFNSYWQKTKENGGTCGFGGTALLIDSDPSYRHCRFSLA